MIRSRENPLDDNRRRREPSPRPADTLAEHHRKRHAAIAHDRDDDKSESQPPRRVES